jgi:hypothetical protein
MAKNETSRLKPLKLQADREAFASLQTIQGYAPAHPAFAVADSARAVRT